MFQIDWMSSQWNLIPCRLTQMDLIYPINWSLDRVWILLTYMALNNPSFRFFYWVTVTCIWIEFIEMIIDIFCIGILSVVASLLKLQVLIFLPNCLVVWHRCTSYMGIARYQRPQNNGNSPLTFLARLYFPE